jgi:hypothetical protein
MFSPMEEEVQPQSECPQVMQEEISSEEEEGEEEGEEDQE